MSQQLQVASKLEIRSVNRVLWEKRCNCNVTWCNMFENSRTHIDDTECEGKHSTATNFEIVARVNEYILANRFIPVDKNSNELNISHGY
ncbi:HTH_48 domain-containing protein [Nephila pilipes]|uniref:HTH_48 domain-containing protein n=1 Tax=Nephila pilipes TaxID=299642 RepID=A0A8X6PNU2_NEPPI|nr:HTH_48 domain-containing protein [Nephila pilipes]